MQPLGTSSGSILKLLLFPFFYQLQEDTFCLILYDILFYFIHIAQGQGESTLGGNFLWKQKGPITLIPG